MAIYHLSFKLCKRSEGKSSVYLAAYQNRNKFTDNRTGAVWNYSKKEGFDGSLILAPPQAPGWLVKSSEALWNEVERTERQKNGQTARYFDVALPVELDDKQKKDLLIKYCQDNFVDEGMIADIAFHDLNSKNPHAHVMLTMKNVGPEGFLTKNREWNDKKCLEAWRQNWEVITNEALKKYGHKSRIDCRTLEEQKEEAERKAKVAKTPQAKAAWIAKSIRLDRTPMTRIHRHNWKAGQKLRKLEQEERKILYKKASLTYHQMTKPIEPEQSMKIEKSQIAQKIKSIFETAKNKLNSKIADFFKPKPKKETPEKFVSSYEIDELGNHILKKEAENWDQKNNDKIKKQVREKKEKEESERLRLKEEDQKLKNSSKPIQQNTNTRKLKR
ncbi:MobQ family relaxase [Enterobacter hormaechei subsp. hormaechei]|uniref:MobQ family relaxase n=1 Tax=Enterobacter hormaechei TaxID=158836 RepID=UPI003F43975C